MLSGAIELTVNGRAVRAAPGSTILQAVAAAGQRLPLMCFSRSLAPEEACRLCIVEVEGEDRPLAACATPARQGMTVRTDSDRLRRERHTIFRLLLSDHYGDCLPPCNQRCPTNIDIQGYIALIARGQYLEACRLIRRTNPLPLTCGRVCPHPCEGQCRRGRVDEPVNINHLKRFASDIGYADLAALNPVPDPPSGQRVAVVGGGPAGLTAAYYLALKGHAPVIHEAMPALGGMLRYGIPEYRLPKAALDREIEAILALGVQARLNTAWGRDFTLSSLLEDGFQAVFLGIGAWINRRMNLAGEDVEGIWPGTVFLNQVAQGLIGGLGGRRVGVVGGGNTAMDCARTALRLGAASVTVYYRRSRKEMPAQAVEVEEAEREGVELSLCTAPTEVFSAQGKLTGMGFTLMELCELDDSGRAQPKPVAGSETRVSLDCLIVAIGQAPEMRLLDKDPLASQLARSRRQTVEGDYLTGATNLARVFVAGDLVTGPATVVEAIGGARRAAEAMDRFLRGRPVGGQRRFVFSKGTLKEVDQVNFQGREHLARAKMPELAPAERRENFREVELGLSEEQARTEALRCLSCGCQAAADCRIRQVGEQLDMREIMISLHPTQPAGLVEDHPRIAIDDNKCVVCRTCERACRDYHGRRAVGVELEPAREPGRPRLHRTRINADCDSCGLCVSLCPTGALTLRTPWPKPGPLPLVWSAAVCNLCPLGCRLRLGRTGDHLARVEGAMTRPNLGHLCARGRFELLETIADPARLKVPLLRRGSGLAPASWEEALGEASEGLSAIRRAQGGQALAVLSLGRASQEEMFLLGCLARLGLGTNNLDCLDPAQEKPRAGRLLAGQAGGPALPPYERLEEADLAVLVGGGLAERLRLLEPALRRLKARGGRVALYAGAEDGLAAVADLRLDEEPARALEAVADLLEERDPGSFVGRWLATARGVVILAAESDLGGEGLAAFQRLASAAASRPGRLPALGLIPSTPNGRGALSAGLSPWRLPGARPLNEANRQAFARVLGAFPPAEPGLFADQILTGAEEGRIKGLVVQAGLNPALERTSVSLLQAAARVDFLVVLACLPEPLCQSAKVVLPRALCLETVGEFVDGSGRAARAEAAAPPSGFRDGVRALGGLLRAMGGPVGLDETEAVRQRMQELARAMRGS